MDSDSLNEQPRPSVLAYELARFHKNCRPLSTRPKPSGTLDERLAAARANGMRRGVKVGSVAYKVLVRLKKLARYATLDEMMRELRLHADRHQVSVAVNICGKMGLVHIMGKKPRSYKVTAAGLQELGRARIA